MIKSVDELLDYAEHCLSKASFVENPSFSGKPSDPVAAAYWQRQCELATALAQAAALASVTKVKAVAVDLSK